MSLTNEQVADAYLAILARPPLTKEQTMAFAAFNNPWDLAQSLLDSKEFAGRRCRRRLHSTSVNAGTIASTYRALLGRDPESERVVSNQLKRGRSQLWLIRSMLQSKEYVKRAAACRDIRSPEFNARPKVIFLHIPKTAGTSFDLATQSVFGDRASISRTGSFDVNSWARADLIGGHFFRNQFDGMTAPRLFVSVVREPVDRAISLYNFYRHERFGRDCIAEAKRLKFDRDDMRRTLQHSSIVNEFINNRQCRFLSGYTNFASVRRAFSQDAFIVGHLAEIKAWIDCLADRLGWTVQDLPTENVARDNSYADEFHHDKDLIDYIRSRNRDDNELYEFIRSHGVYESAPPAFDYSLFALS